jgi:hypothetical protein
MGVDEAQTRCERDAGTLRGRSLCGPILIVDPMDLAAISNQPDPGRALKAEGGCRSLFETLDGLQQRAAPIQPGFVVHRLVQCFDDCIDAQLSHGVDRRDPELLEAPNHDRPQPR